MSSLETKVSGMSGMMTEDWNGVINFFAHEFRGALASASAYSELVFRYGRDIENEEKTGLVRSIYESVQRANHELEKFLELNRLRTDRLKLHPSGCSLPDLLKPAIEVCDAKGEKVRWEVLSDEEEVKVWFDEQKLRFICFELVQNICEHGEGVGEVRIFSEDDELVMECVNDRVSRGKHYRGELGREILSLQGRNGYAVGLYLVRTILQKAGGEAEFLVEPRRFVARLFFPTTTAGEDR